MNTENDIYKQQQKQSLLQFLSELPNAVMVTAAALLSKSLLMWMDFVDSAGNLLRSTMVFMMSKKLKKNLIYEYNYGTGKIEAVASIICDIILIISVSIIGFMSLRDLFLPKQPSDMLLYVIFLKVINVSIDIYLYIKQKKVSRTQSGTVFASAERAMKKNLCFDGAALVSIAVSYFLRDILWAWYVIPVLTLALVVLFFVGAVRSIRRSVSEILDKTADEQTQMKILKTLTSLFDEYEQFGSVSTRQSAGCILIDVSVSFGENTTYRQIKDFTRKITELLKAEIDNCSVRVIIEDAVDKEL